MAPVYSPAIQGSVHGVTSTFISAYSHPLSSLLQYTARPEMRLKKVHFLPNGDPYWHQPQPICFTGRTQVCGKNFATVVHAISGEIANTHDDSVI